MKKLDLYLLKEFISTHIKKIPCPFKYSIPGAFIGETSQGICMYLRMDYDLENSQMDLFHKYFTYDRAEFREPERGEGYTEYRYINITPKN